MRLNIVSLLFILKVLPPVPVTSQDHQTIQVNGQIIDKGTREGIAFAHIYIENTPIGTITDLHGYFTIAYTHTYQRHHLRVSCMGYKPITIPLTDVNSGIEISLEQNVIELDEVTVKPLDPLILLREAHKKIPENYDSLPAMLSGYYKLSSNLGDRNVRYTEAFIDVYKPGYKPTPDEKLLWSDSIYLREIRTKRSDIKDWKFKAMLDWENSLYEVQRRDLARELTHLNNDKLIKIWQENYVCEIENMVLIDGRPTYMITLKAKKNKRDALWNGAIYIDEETKAFVKYDLVSSPQSLKKLKGSLGYIIMSKLYGVKYEGGEWKESMAFQFLNGKWYFKEVNSSKKFVISSNKRGIKNEQFDLTLHYRTDSIKRNIVIPDTADFLPTRKEAWWITEKYINDRFNPSFWKLFDEQQGVLLSDSTYKKTESTVPSKNEYVVTRLDTLQGSLTPLRTCFDVEFYHLTVEVMPEDEFITGNSLIRFRVSEPTQKIQIDLYSEMKIDSLICGGNPLKFEREYNAVYVHFPEKLVKGSVHEIAVYFAGHPVEANFDIPVYAAFLWSQDEEENPWFQAICQGYGASGWWPNKDHLSDEPDSAMITVTVPADLEVVANGRLRQKYTSNNKTTCDWFVSYPINNYNITLNAGKYTRLQDRYIGEKDTIDLEYHVLSNHLDLAPEKLKMVKPMLKVYEKYFGPYPFPNDGFKLVESPHAMEHQSCVSVGSQYFSEPASLDFKNGKIDFQIVLHETAHEWWGNNVSCTDNAELWIHEAFATYAEALYIEEIYGTENSGSYLNWMKTWVKNQYPLIGTAGINHIHYDITDMYSRGALMLHTFRNVLNNDSLWFTILRGLQKEFSYQTINTTDIMEYINGVTQTDYTYFFDQYLRHTSLPELEVTFTQQGSSLQLKYRWKVDVKAFRMPVRVKTGKEQSEFIYPSQEWQSFTLENMTIEDFEVDDKNFFIKTFFTKLP